MNHHHGGIQSPMSTQSPQSQPCPCPGPGGPGGPGTCGFASATPVPSPTAVKPIALAIIAEANIFFRFIVHPLGATARYLLIWRGFRH